ncbi:MAG: signal recognition particle-docking protein FtsY [Chloroflexi bacterium]|jgi:fused signal recognition particle receptor|nr:signal recognition particle-docking protein FtsY [Anaerolineae bacterium]MCC6567075.1 signal recognition particle-docking protein FtsY [Chloroflexota bacterium]RIK22567.1 MAG: signal recognition particle-docking protein FtsY [Chloroflexota bacterium]
MSKTRQSFFGRLASVLGGGGAITDDTWDDIEAVLIQSDLGVHTAQAVVEDLRAKANRESIRDPERLQAALRQVLKERLRFPPTMNISGRELSVVLIVGVNGSGKTTSIAKLAHRLKLAGRKVMLCAGDTFRAAAIEQLQMWGERVGVPVVAGKQGGDPAALVFDAVTAAKARGIDVLIIDTAGRLHNNANLMDELAKVKAVCSRVVPDAPHEVLLVLDGTTGQNALEQAKKFGEVVNVTGAIVTKLDGSAKGGMVFAVFEELGLPVQYVGLGEGMDDMVLFNPENFTLSLFGEN